MIKKLKFINDTGILDIDLSWLNNNYQRIFTNYVDKCSAHRICNLKSEHMYTVLTCFLLQTYKNTTDYIIDMYDKLLIRIYNSAQTDIDEHLKTKRKTIQKSLHIFNEMGKIILNENVDDINLRKELFLQINKEQLVEQLNSVNDLLDKKYNHVFLPVSSRFSYIRQFFPAFLEQINFQSEENNTLLDAIEFLKDLNKNNKRTLPYDETPLEFVPNNLKSFVISEEGINKHAWECALLTAIKDGIKSGNLSVVQSKRFGNFDNFFFSKTKWDSIKKDFFKRAGFPESPFDLKEYFKERLNKAFDKFLEKLPENSYAKIDENGWHLSVDPATQHDLNHKVKLDNLKSWIASKMRTIKLPALLIEVDNDLFFANQFLPIVKEGKREAEDICNILITIIAHGCNIGAYTMARLTKGITYNKIKHVTDWQLTEDAQKKSLSIVVNAISKLDVTQYWGNGTTSSSDGQRFTLKRKVLQRTYSPRFNDFAIEFYSFVADNYAPFYSTPIECTDRDAAYVLDGLLYNESDLALEEHFVDTHGYTEINYAAFAMYGRKFSPRIRGVQHQLIYKIDKNKNYGTLSSLVSRSDRTIHMDYICDQWDKMGHFYASLEDGHTTASTALKRLVSFNGKNNFYRANRELGRILKTEDILHYMSCPITRQKRRQGLLKGEQLHALARDVNYAKRGRISTQNLDEQRNSCNCLTLILACIIYWQAKELNRIINEYDPISDKIDISLIEHISPIGWDNIILYGEYVLDRNLIRK